jgi:subtilisin family serine protease
MSGIYFRRRYTFLGLLLLALLAPAGMVAAGEFTQPYVVFFNPAAVAAAQSEIELTPQAGNAFRFLAASPAQQARIARGQTVFVAPDSIDSLDSLTGGGLVDSQRVINHVREISVRNRVRINSVYSNAVGGFAADLTPAQLRAISRNPAVAQVIPDAAVQLDDGADGTAGKAAGILRSVSNPAWHVPAGVRRVGARSAQVAAFTHRSTRINADVAILDTGVDRNHPDLNVVGGYNCTTRNENKWDDTHGHGTHVAGIVGARDNRIGVVGVAPGVRLWSVKVLDRQGRGYVSWIVCGIDWVTAQRDPQNHSRPLIEVANMSISFGLGHSGRSECGDGSDSIHQAICRSVKRGTVYVVAAGNDSRNARRNRPAAYDEVITVSAMADYDGRGGGRGKSSDSCPVWSPERDDAFTDFSNYGAVVDLIAPGRCILSTYMGKRYAWMSGTSMAAPHVAGAAAIYRAMFPRAKPSQVKLALVAAGRYDWRVATDPDRKTYEPSVWIGQFRRMPDFDLSVVPQADSVARGGRLELTVKIDRMGGFDAPVTLSLADNGRDGFVGRPVLTPRSRATFYVNVDDSMRAGTYVLTLVGRSGDIAHKTTFEITVRRR